MMYTFCVLGAWLIWHTLYRFRNIDRCNLPRVEKGQPGRVIVCNHLAGLDPVFLAISSIRWPGPVILGKAELFEIHPLLTWFFRSVGAVAVRRGKGDMQALDTVIARVKAGRDVLIFPEGTRSKTGEMGPLKSGAFLIAARTGSTVVPCRLFYETGKPRFFRRVRLAWGRPLSREELGFHDDWEASPMPSVLRQAKKATAARMEQLREQYGNTVC